MPATLRALLADGAPPSSVCASELREALPHLPLSMPMGVAGDVLQKPNLIGRAGCAALRAALDAGCDQQGDSVDGAPDYQLNLSADQLRMHIGAECMSALAALARELDVQRGGSGRRELPLVEAFVRRYTANTRPFHPFHQDRAAITVNVALTDDGAHGGGVLIGLFDDGARAFERAEGTATVHLSRIVHGVTRMTRGVRYSLICFLGDEPAVRRQLERMAQPDGTVVERWTRTVVEP